MDKLAVANDVADQLFEAERSVDLAMLKATKLIETMLYARGSLDLSAAAGQSAVRRVASAVSGLGEVRGGLVLAHASLERLGRDLNLPVEAGGGGGKPSDSPVLPLLSVDEMPLREPY